jgi:hypothetical protein
MSNTARNKKFRNHCNIDVLLSKENNTVLVKLSYKPELLMSPIQPHPYKRSDVIEELTRQGITVNPSSAPPRHIDNSSVSHRRKQYLEAEYTFELSAKLVAPSDEVATKEVETTFSESKPKLKAKRKPGSLKPKVVSEK